MCTALSDFNNYTEQPDDGAVYRGLKQGRAPDPLTVAKPFKAAPKNDTCSRTGASEPITAPERLEISDDGHKLPSFEIFDIAAHHKAQARFQNLLAAIKGWKLSVGGRTVLTTRTVVWPQSVWLHFQLGQSWSDIQSGGNGVHLKVTALHCTGRMLDVLEVPNWRLKQQCDGGRQDLHLLGLHAWDAEHDSVVAVDQSLLAAGGVEAAGVQLTLRIHFEQLLAAAEVAGVLAQGSAHVALLSAPDPELQCTLREPAGWLSTPCDALASALPAGREPHDKTLFVIHDFATVEGRLLGRCIAQLHATESRGVLKTLRPEADVVVLSNSGGGGDFPVPVQGDAEAVRTSMARMLSAHGASLIMDVSLYTPAGKLLFAAARVALQSTAAADSAGDCQAWAASCLATVAGKLLFVCFEIEVQPECTMMASFEASNTCQIEYGSQYIEDAGVPPKLT